MTAVHCVAVVGGGPMCTYALAHLAAVLPDAPPAAPVRIVVFERGGRAGAGEVHSDAQPPTGYLNRVAGQIAFAPDESSDPPRTLLPVALRPTFQEWCADRYARTGRPDFDVRPYDVPKRYVHGLALRELFLRYVDRLQGVAGVTVELYDAEVTGVTRGAGPSGAGGDRFVLRSADGAELTADEVLFVTGHSWNTPAPGSEEERLAAHEGYVPTPYPLAGRLDERTVRPGRPVAVRGLGLTAIDVFLQLTEGRGGVFVPDADAAPHGLRYVPAGREPSVIVAVSPSGVPVSGRPLNDKVADPGLEHTGVFFTVDAVRALRATVGVPLPDGRRPLDFDLHLFPLVCLEMAWVHHRTLRGDVGVRPLRGAVTAAYRDFLAGRGPWGEEGADALVRAFEAPLAAEGSTAAGRFEWRALLDPLPAGSARRGDDGADWARRSAAFLRRDHRDALEGNLRNTVKAACDGVWRDLRAVFGEAVDFGGLTPDSHRRFVRTHLRHYNRLSNGAGPEPMRKVLALLDAGVLDLSVGPRPEVCPAGDGARGFTVTGGLTGVVRAVDAVVEGRVHPFDPRRDVLPLYRSLLDAGLVRLWRNQGPGAEDFVPGALDLTDRFHPVLPDGSSEPRLTFLGAPAEGLRVFQQSAARPHSNSSVLAVAADWAEEAARRMPRRTAPRAPHTTADRYVTPPPAPQPLAAPTPTAPVPAAPTPARPNPPAPRPAARVPVTQGLAAPGPATPTPAASAPDAPPRPAARAAAPPTYAAPPTPTPAPQPLAAPAPTPARPNPPAPRPAARVPVTQGLAAPGPTAPTPAASAPDAPPRPAARAAASPTFAAPHTPAPAPQPLAARPPGAPPPTDPPPAAPPAPPTFAAPAPGLPASAVAAVPNSEGWTTR